MTNPQLMLYSMVKSISFKVKNKTKISTLSTFIQYSFGSPRHDNQRRKRNKRIQIGKEVKLSLFADDLILYTENPKDATRKLLEPNNEYNGYNKITGYKINTQKYVDKRSEGEIKEVISLTITSKRIKYLGLNIPNEAKTCI